MTATFEKATNDGVLTFTMRQDQIQKLTTAPLIK